MPFNHFHRILAIDEGLRLDYSHLSPVGTSDWKMKGENTVYKGHFPLKVQALLPHHWPLY